MADFLRTFKRCLCLTAAIVASGVWDASGATRPMCPPAGAHVLARDRVLRVYTPAGSRPLAQTVVACLVRQGSRMTLVRAAPRTSVGTIVLSGPLVAYLRKSFGVDTSGTTLVVANVATRRTLRETGVGASTDAGLLFYERVTDLVLARDGAVAWIAAHRGPGPGTPTLAVHAAPPTATPVVLDEGPSIGATSLSLSGRMLSWTDDTTRHTAQLPS